MIMGLAIVLICSDGLDRELECILMAGPEPRRTRFADP